MNRSNRRNANLVIFGASLIVHGAKVIAFILGPAAGAAIVFLLVGHWLGFFDSVTVRGGWGVVLASLAFIALYFLGKYLDRKLGEMEGKPESGQTDA